MRDDNKKILFLRGFFFQKNINFTPNEFEITIKVTGQSELHCQPMASARAAGASPPAHAGTKLVALPIEAEGIPAASDNKVIFTAAAPTIEGHLYKTVVWYAKKSNAFQAIAFDDNYGDEGRAWYAALRQDSAKRSEDTTKLNTHDFLNNEYIVGNVHAEFDPLFVANIMKAPDGDIQTSDTWTGDTHTLQHCAQLLCNVLLRLNHHVASVWIKSKGHASHRLAVTETETTHKDGTAMPWATEVVKNGTNREVYFLNHKLVSVIYNSISDDQQMQAPTVHGSANAQRCRHHADAMAKPARYLNFDLFTYVNWKPAGGDEGPSPPRRASGAAAPPPSAGRHRSQPPMPVGPPPAAAGWGLSDPPPPMHHSPMHADPGPDLMGYLEAPLGSGDLTIPDPAASRELLTPQIAMDEAPDGAEGGDDGFDWAAVPTQQVPAQTIVPPLGRESDDDDDDYNEEKKEEEDEYASIRNGMRFEDFLLDEDQNGYFVDMRARDEQQAKQEKRNAKRREKGYDAMQVDARQLDSSSPRDPFADRVRLSDQMEERFYRHDLGRNERIRVSREKQKPFATARAAAAEPKAKRRAIDLDNLQSILINYQQIRATIKVRLAELDKKKSGVEDQLYGETQVENAEKAKNLTARIAYYESALSKEHKHLAENDNNVISIEQQIAQISTSDLAGQAARTTQPRDDD